MTHAELLRSHADVAMREGGMYYSGEYLSRIAATAESLEADNANLREFAHEAYELLTCTEPVFVWRGLQEKARELEIEVSA